MAVNGAGLRRGQAQACLQLLFFHVNPFNAKGERTLLVVTLRVASHNYVDLYTELKG